MKNIIYILLLFYTSVAVSQTKLEKYWYYRQRLTDYFVKIGENPGESVVAQILNVKKSKELKLSDGTIDLGNYIAVLATEYKLLSDNNQNVQNTLTELYYAIEAYKRLDNCESKEPWNKSEDSFDGFFNRQDVELFNDHNACNLVGRNTGLTAQDTFGTKPLGHPTYVDVVDEFGIVDEGFAMSQDQVAHLFKGFALVKKCLPDYSINLNKFNGENINYNFVTEVRDITDKIIRYIRGDLDTWLIKDPNGDLVSRGPNAIWNSYGILKAAEYITDYTYISALALVSMPIWLAQIQPNTENDYNTTMAMSFAAIGNSWSKKEGLYLILNSPLCEAIPTLPIITDPNTGLTIPNIPTGTLMTTCAIIGARALLGTAINIATINSNN
jgi:hypothetical protein